MTRLDRFLHRPDRVISDLDAASRLYFRFYYLLIISIGFRCVKTIKRAYPFSEGAQLRDAAATMVVADANERLALAVATILLGQLMKRLRLVDVDVGKALLRIIFGATLPSVLLCTFATLKFDASSGAVVLAGVLHAGVLFLASFVAFRKRTPGKERALLAGSSVGVNLGTFSYPLVDAVWAQEGLSKVVLFDAVNQFTLLFVQPLIYVACVAGSSFSPLRALRSVGKTIWSVSPCLLAMVVAVGLQLSGKALPMPVEKLCGSLALANKPLALLALGILFEPQLKARQLYDVACILAVRYGASLLLAAALLATVGPAVGPVASAVITLALLSPVPLLTVTYAVEHGCDTALAAAAVNAANICSFGFLLAVVGADFAHPLSIAPQAAVLGAGLLLAGFVAATRNSTTTTPPPRGEDTPAAAATTTRASAGKREQCTSTGIRGGIIGGRLRNGKGQGWSNLLTKGLRSRRGSVMLQVAQGTGHRPLRAAATGIAAHGAAAQMHSGGRTLGSKFKSSSWVEHTPPSPCLLRAFAVV